MSSGVLGQLHARPIFSLISDTPDSMKFVSLVSPAAVRGEDSAIIVYLKRMSSNYPEIWPDGDFLYEIKRPTAFGQSINDYHASERPWLLADVVFERIGRDDE